MPKLTDDQLCMLSRMQTEGPIVMGFEKDGTTRRFHFKDSKAVACADTAISLLRKRQARFFKGVIYPAPGAVSNARYAVGLSA